MAVSIWPTKYLIALDYVESWRYPKSYVKFAIGYGEFNKGYDNLFYLILLKLQLLFKIVVESRNYNYASNICSTVSTEGAIK